MRSRTITGLALASALLAASPALSGDRTRVEVLGFSPDGKYFLFDQRGVELPAGVPYVKLILVDVAKNEYAGKPVVTKGKAGDRSGGFFAAEARLSALRRANFDKAAKQFAGLNIAAFDPGRVRRPKGLVMVDENSGNRHGQYRFEHKPAAASRKLKYRLDLVLTNQQGKAADEGVCAPFALELNVRKDKDDASKVVFQKDSQIPRWRACAIDYGLEALYLQERHAAALVEVQLPGGGEPSVRYMVVTGTLPD